jgi:hypothetical protein
MMGSRVREERRRMRSLTCKGRLPPVSVCTMHKAREVRINNLSKLLCNYDQYSIDSQPSTFDCHKFST